jgi:hypothetical protein
VSITPVTPGTRIKHRVLLVGGQVPVQRRDVELFAPSQFRQMSRGLVDFAHAGQEHEDVAGREG